MSTRWVVVDDTSVDVNYVGDSWFADVGSRDSAGNFGAPYLSTLHGTNTTASITFNFTGSAVRVVGANHIRNDSGVIDPQWSCYVDGLSISSTTPFQFPENNWRFCYSNSTYHDGPHTITVNATVSKNQTFWFDRFEYLPSKSVSLANQTVVLTNADPAIQYGTGWSNYAGIGNLTQQQNALVALNFYGTSLSWYGHIPTEWSGNSTTATWAIDHNPAQIFVLKGHGANASTAYNQKFFETPVYPFGSHKLTVTYNGDSSKTPLVLAYLVMQNNTVANSTLESASTSTMQTSSQTLAIVGGVVGGVACLLIIALLLLWRCRQRLQRLMAMIKKTGTNYISVPPPIPYHPRTRLPAKVLEASSTLSARRHPGPSELSSTSPTTIATTSDGQYSRSLISDASRDTGPSSFVVHQDSGARLPQAMQRPLTDIPPAYTPD